MDPLKTYDEEAIERFVLNQMSEAELDAFLAHMALHPEIQPRIKACRERIKAFRAVSHPPPTDAPRKWVWPIAILLTVIGIAWFFLHEKPEPLPAPAPAGPEASPAPGASKQEPIAQVQDTGHNHPKTNPRPLANNYSPNETLDMQVSSAVRGESLELKLESPAPDDRLKLQSGGVIFHLSGTAEQKKAAIPGSLQVFIYDNQQMNVEAKRYLATFKLPVASRANGINSFELTKKINLGPGLFYYIVEDEKGDWQFVGRFRVK